MKKSYFYLFVAAFFAGIIISSCKSHEKCPAYSKINNQIKAIEKLS